MKPAGLPEARRLRKAMRKAGALDPGTALPASAFNEILDSDIDPYVEAGVLREGPSQTFYLHEPTASLVIRKQTLMAVVFWFLVIIIPVAILQLSNSRPPSP
jgi:hypothetical protein